MKLCTVTIVCLLGMMLSGCSYSTTAHQFEFYGSTQESFGRDFFYVKYGVTGSATATYTARGGGFVREGLIADAKRELIASHPLGPNQSYVNMSVDITQTQTGGAYGESVYVSKIDLTATISADVIQFGQPPLDYSLPIELGRSINTVDESPTLPSIKSGLTKVNTENGILTVGDIVSFIVRQDEKITGEVLAFVQTPNGCIAQIKYTYEGKETISTLPIDILTRVVTR